jgi:hypothetical protein
MEATLNNTEEALNKKGVIIDRWILRLGKNYEEAGKFTPWFLPSNTLKEDYAAFLACLSLTRLVDSVEERMKGQKSSIRAVKKEQRETAKAFAKEQAKLQKALDKAAAKIAKEAEKVRIKAEAKAERERLKAEKKAGKECGFTSMTVPIPMGSVISLVSSTQDLLKSPDIQPAETPQPESTISTEVLVLSERDAKVLVEALLNPPEPNAALKSLLETETYTPTFKLPMEG